MEAAQFARVEAEAKNVEVSLMFPAKKSKLLITGVVLYPCPHCGKHVPERQRICEHCGQKIEARKQDV